MVELKGFEPLASCVQGRRSSQLSYSPVMGFRFRRFRIAPFPALKMIFFQKTLKTELYDASGGSRYRNPHPRPLLEGLSRICKQFLLV